MCRKAIKATIILLPLLGMTNLLFLAQPAEQGPLLVAYRVINAVLPSCQVSGDGEGEQSADGEGKLQSGMVLLV